MERKEPGRKAQLKRVDYAKAGVNTEREEAALKGLLKWLVQSFSLRTGVGTPKLDVGYFANIIDVGHHLGIAVSTDGVGTKVLIAQLLEKYDTIGIDCVAMNVNDVLCVGAEPLCLLDYIAIQDPDPTFLEEIGKGLYKGAELANITIPAGEIAQMRDVIKGVRRHRGFDLVGTCVGLVPLDRVIIGQEIQEGDVVIGLRSSGIHSNGLTLARKVLFQKAKLRPDQDIEELGRPLGEELLEPTRIYVREVLTLLRSGLTIKALIHITSDGFLNLTRVQSDVGYVIDTLPEPQPIFALIQKLGNVSDEEMFRVYNMGIGFCLVVPEDQVEAVMNLLQNSQVEAFRIGYAVADKERKVLIQPKGLVGQGSAFRKEACS
ncbi:MAG: phosphoribosylformylglycinamidine cyclo-ligase [Nitrospirae bacterium]|nr:phosphoribosylformylglycinamidine cyclo-ligase [Nitrospirota bacterium]